MNLRVSIIIPVWNAWETLSECLTSLTRVNLQPLEILLVDNQSTDESLVLLQNFSHKFQDGFVRVLSEKKRGATSARNCGIRASQGDIVAFTDADCIVDANWIEQILSPFHDQEVGAVAGKVVPTPSTTLVEQFSGLYTLRSSDDKRIYREWSPWEGGFPTANFAVRRQLLEQVGGFSEEVEIYGEDYDLCARLYKQGSAIVYTPHAIVSHVPRKTVTGMMRQAFGFGKSHSFLLRRHPTGRIYVDLPGKSVRLTCCSHTAWFDLASADKKLGLLVLMGYAYQPLLAFLGLYVIWLLITVRRHATDDGAQLSSVQLMGIGVLLVGKSLALTIGRWWGSVKYRAVCF